MPLSDGVVHLPPAYFVNADWAAHQSLLSAGGTLDLPIGCFLIRSGDATILMDAGIGPGSNQLFEGGQLPGQLAAAGVEPEDVDVVVCSHLHIDHTGWLVRDETPFFPNAIVRFGSADWDHFVTHNDPGDTTRQAMEVLAAAGRIAPIDRDGEALAPGITALAAPGHTPGHFCAVLSSGDQRALLLGDAVTCPIQLEETEWSAWSDVDKTQAARTREALWRELEGTDDVAVAAHFPGLQFGRILTGEGKRYFQVP